MKTYGLVEVWLHAFLISALDGDEWSTSSSGFFTSGTHWRGDWVDPRAGGHGNGEEKIPAQVGNRTPIIHPVV
jgi:hypothetical protein